MLLAVILFLLAFTGVAQPSETWYFAQMIDDGEIVAFTIDGDVHPLGINGDWQFALRADAETVLLAVAPEDSDTKLYRVRPDGAVEIDIPGSVEDFRQPLAFSDPYLVLRQSSSPLPTTALLINVDSAQAQPLTGQLPALAGMSADGAFLRYMSVSSDGEQWSLIERALATGNERVIHTFTTDNPLPLISADTHGDRWIYQGRGEDGALVSNLLSIDGTFTMLGSGTREQPIRWSFLHDDLIGNPFNCGDTCVLQLVNDASEVEIPTPSEGFYFPLAVPQPGSLLIQDSDDHFWLLSQADEPRLLGEYDATRVFMPPHQLVSPEARYVLTATGDEQYGVWDLQTGSPVALVNARFIGLILYTEHGFLIHSYGDETDNGLAYRYADGETLALPHTDVGIYLDLLADGTLVYMLQRADDAVGEPGIYRYDPAAETYMLILPGARLTYPAALG
jgi:hypothetical protein